MLNKNTETNRNYVTAEDWKKKYIPKDTLIEQKYEELADDPAALAEFLVKNIANNARVEMSKKH